MTWPPPARREEEVPHRPWDPRHRRAKGLVKEHDLLVYVVVDEIVEGWVGLSVSSWPHADGHGRLRFLDPDGAVDIGTSQKGLHTFLKSTDPAAAEPTVGHTFAARAKKGNAAKLLRALRDRAGGDEARIRDIGKILEQPVDLTEHGRRLAKLACYGAVLSTMPSKLADDWNLREEEEP